MRHKPSERGVSTRVPQRNAGGPLEASKGVGVDEQAASQEVTEGRTIDAGRSGERHDGLAPLVEDATQNLRCADDLGDTSGGILAGSSGQELTDDGGRTVVLELRSSEACPAGTGSGADPPSDIDSSPVGPDKLRCGTRRPGSFWVG